MNAEAEADRQCPNAVTYLCMEGGSEDKRKGEETT
jgi:hypothetical protein